MASTYGCAVPIPGSHPIECRSGIQGPLRAVGIEVPRVTKLLQWEVLDATETLS